MYRKSKQQLHTSRADAKDSSLSSTELVVPSCVSRVVSYPVVKDGYEKTMDFYQSRVRKSSFRVVRGLAAASEMGVGLGVGVGLTILKEGQRRTPSAIGDRLKLLDECAVTGLAALEHRFPIITQETDKTWQQASDFLDDHVFKKTNAFVDGKVKPNVERFKEHMKAKQEKIVESPVVTNLLTRADSVIDTIVPPDSKEEMAGMQQPNGTPSNVERAKNLTSKVAHRIQKRYVRVRSYSSDSVRAAYSDVRKHWDQEYYRAQEEVMPRGRGISGQGVGQKTGAGKLLNSPLVQQTRVVSKALYRTLLHYSDLSYEELVHLVQRASKSAKSSTVAATSAAESNFGALGAFLTHLLQAPFALARHPLTLLEVRLEFEEIAIDLDGVMDQEYPFGYWQLFSERFANRDGARATSSLSSRWETERLAVSVPTPQFACSTTPINSTLHPSARGSPHPSHMSTPVRSTASIETVAEVRSVRSSDTAPAGGVSVANVQEATSAPSDETASPMDVVQYVHTPSKEQSSTNAQADEEPQLQVQPAAHEEIAASGESSGSLRLSPSGTSLREQAAADLLAGDTESEQAASDFMTALESSPSRCTSPSASEFTDAESTERGSGTPSPSLDDDATLIEPH